MNDGTRILLFSGKGGVGKTTTAAATALAASDLGKSVLVMSTDPAHSLSDAFGCELGDAPESVEGDLWAVEIDAQQRLESNWSEISEYLAELIDSAGVSGIQAEELTVLPGLDEIFSLCDIKDYADSGSFDVLIVDCAPTAETIRLLSLPDVFAWAMERLFPAGRRIARIARPIWNRIPSLPDIADDDVFGHIEELYSRLDGVRELLSDPDTSSVRLVMNAERMVIAESQRMYTYLSLFGYHVDMAIVNKLIPDEVVDPYFAAWKSAQDKYLPQIEAAFAPLPIRPSRLFEEEVVGIDSLRRYAEELYPDGRCLDGAAKDLPLRVFIEGDECIVSIHLPFVSRDEVDIVRNEDQLFVTVGPYKRMMFLPTSLVRRELVGATIDGDRLLIRFGVNDVAFA